MFTDEESLLETSSACRAPQLQPESGCAQEIHLVHRCPSPIFLRGVLHKDVDFVSSICMCRKYGVYLEILTAN